MKREAARFRLAWFAAAILVWLPGCCFLERGDGRVQWHRRECEEIEIDALIHKIESGEVSEQALAWRGPGDPPCLSLGELHAAKSACIVRHAPIESLTALPILMGVELMRAPESIPSGIACILFLSPIMLPFDIIQLPIQLPIRIVNHLSVSQEDLDRALRSLSRARRLGHDTDCVMTGDMFFRPKTLDAIGYALPPPGPCPPTMETVRHGLRMHLESLRPAGAPPGCYRAAPGEPPSLAASCDAAILRWLMDDLSARAERKAWIEEIASQQDPRTGEWPGESRQVGTAVRALKVLRGKPRHPLCYLKVIEEPAAMEAWLDARDWSDPWAAAIEIQDAATPHIAGGTKGKEWLDRFFARLEAEQDPQTGFWTAGADASLEDGMAATFHIVPVYRAAGRSIPYKEAMLGSIFALRMPEGSFRSRCCQVDACHILQSLGAGDNRAREALRGVFEDLLRRWDAEAAIFRGASNLHELAAIYQVLLDTAPTAEDHRLARLTWRDAWDPALWEAPIR